MQNTYLLRPRTVLSHRDDAPLTIQQNEHEDGTSSTPDAAMATPSEAPSPWETE